MSHDALQAEWASINFAMRDVATVTNADAVIKALAPCGARRECVGLKRTEIDNSLDNPRPLGVALSVPVEARKSRPCMARRQFLDNALILRSAIALIRRSAEGASRRMLQGALIGWRSGASFEAPPGRLRTRGRNA